MKTTIGLVIFLCLTAAFFIRGSSVEPDNNTVLLYPADFSFPADVKAIIDKKCYGCHSYKGKIADAKKGLMWDSISHLSKRKIIGKLDHIIDVLDDGSMPPKEILQKYPDAKLLPEERQILRNWAVATADSLLN